MKLNYVLKERLYHFGFNSESLKDQECFYMGNMTRYMTPPKEILIDIRYDEIYYTNF